MTILTHAVFGALIGNQIGRAGEAALAGFVSHFVLDLIPHNDYFYFYGQRSDNPYTTVTSKIIFGLTLIYLALIYTLGNDGFSFSPSFWGAVFALLPDALTAFNVIFKRKAGLTDRLQRYCHERESLSEFLHNRLSRSPKIKGGPAGANTLNNFEVLKGSPWGKIGWALETAIELTLLTVSLNLLGFLRFSPT